MYKIAKFLRAVLRRSPLLLVYALGAGIGICLYWNTKKRITAFKNVKSAFPEKSNAVCMRIVRKSFIYFGASIVESFIPERLCTWVTINGIEKLGSAGGVLAAIHEGSWELYNCSVAQAVPYAIFAKTQKVRSLDVFLNEVRSRMHLGVCTTLKDAIRLLQKKFFLGFVVDHGAENDALMVDFFGQLVPTPRGAVHLARKFAKQIYPCFGHRRSLRHAIEIGDPIVVGDRLDSDVLTQLNVFFEQQIRRYPNEYLWSYKRFKNKKSLDVAVLSDGKLGHLKQSLALCAMVADMGYRVRVHTIEVGYKNKLLRAFAEACAHISNKECIGCGKCVRAIMGKKAYAALQAIYADVVVSTGSIPAPLNRVYAHSVGAKSVTILHPNTALRKFDLGIIPEHDRIRADNCAIIKGALFYPVGISEKVRACAEFFKLKPSRYISFFLGGSLSDEKVFCGNVLLFLKKLKEFSLAHDYTLLVSTSRRTPEAAQKHVESELEHFKNTAAIVYANRKNYDFVFDGFTSLSQMVFVSSESISMVSEILSMKKPCVCVFFENHLDKHRVFFESISKEVSELRSPYMIDEVSPHVSSLFESNKAIVQEALRKIL